MPGVAPTGPRAVVPTGPRAVVPPGPLPVVQTGPIAVQANPVMPTAAGAPTMPLAEPSFRTTPGVPPPASPPIPSPSGSEFPVRDTSQGGSHGGTGPRGLTNTLPPPTASRRAWWSAFGAAAGVVLIVGVAAAAMRSAPPAPPATPAPANSLPEPELAEHWWLLARVNEPADARATDYTDRHRILDGLAGTPAASRIDVRRNLVLDLVQADQTGAPCEVIAGAMARIEHAPHRYFVPALNALVLPTDGPGCSGLTERREALLATISTTPSG